MTATITAPAATATDAAAADRMALAVLAADALGTALTDATAAGDTLLTDRYGFGADRPAVTLAKLTAADVAGAKPGKGNRRSQVLATLALLTDGAPDTLAYVAAARAVLDAAAAAKVEERAAAKAEREALAADRAAAMSIVNNRGESKQARIEALELVSELDGTRDRAKDDAAWGKLTAAIDAARSYGFTDTQIATLLVIDAA